MSDFRRSAALPSAPSTAPPLAEAVLGVPLALTDYAGTLDWIDAAAEAEAHSYAYVAAIHTVMARKEDPEWRAAVLGADFTVPDGQPLVCRKGADMRAETLRQIKACAL